MSKHGAYCCLCYCRPQEWKQLGQKTKRDKEIYLGGKTKGIGTLQGKTKFGWIVGYWFSIWSSSIFSNLQNCGAWELLVFYALSKVFFATYLASWLWLNKLTHSLHLVLDLGCYQKICLISLFSFYLFHYAVKGNKDLLHKCMPILSWAYVVVSLWSLGLSPWVPVEGVRI